MNRAELGTKLLCESCGVRFYDLNKRGVKCPACGELHKPRVSLPSVPRRVRDRAKAPIPAPNSLDAQSPTKDAPQGTEDADEPLDDAADPEPVDEESDDQPDLKSEV